MDEVYAMELLRQNLISACEREDGLTLKLEAAQNEMAELRRCAIVSKARSHEIENILAIEEAKTNAERLAKQEAEETTRQHRAEALRAKQKAIVANKHCDAAESEVSRLQKEVSTEHSAKVAAELLSSQLREDLGLAKINEKIAYEQLHFVRSKASTLQEDVCVASDRIKMLERQVEEFVEVLEKGRQRVEEAENALSMTSCELESKKLELRAMLEKYNDLAATQSKCDFPDSAVTTAFDTGSVEIKSAKHEREQGFNTESDAKKNRPYFFEIGSSRERKRSDISTELPAFPEPAMLRPALASVTACQVEVFKASGRFLPAPTGNLRSPLWELLCRLPSNPLNLIFRGVCRR